MKRRVKRSRQRKGFTLMEVLLVMAILVIIASVSTVAYTKIQKAQQKKAAELQIKNLKTGVVSYQLTIGTAPQNLDELKNGPANAALAKAKGFKPGDIWEGEIPLDPWGHAYVYKYDPVNDKVLIYSVGPNGSDETGGGDDITGDS